MGRKERTLLIAIAANVVLIVLRFFLARISGSVALKASAWHSFSDIFVSLFVLTGFVVFRIVEEPRLKKVNRIENIIDRKSTRLNSSHIPLSRMPSSA